MVEGKSNEKKTKLTLLNSHLLLCKMVAQMEKNLPAIYEFSSVEFSCCWKRVFAMTSEFSWQNSVSLCLASFFTPRPNLPVTPGIS